MYLTQWHIDRAKKALTENNNICSCCPLALMFEDYFNGYIEVSYTYLNIYKDGKRTIFELSEQMVYVIQKFDSTEYIIPQHFTQPLKFTTTVEFEHFKDTANA